MPTDAVTRFRGIIVSVSLACLSISCGKSATAPGDNHFESTGRISDVLFAAQVAPGATRFEPSTGSAPASGGGPTANVSGTTTITGLFEAAYNLDSSVAFQKVFVTVAGKTGFIQLDLSAPTTTQLILLSFNALASDVTVQFQLATAAGVVGPVAALPLTVEPGKLASLTASATPDPIPFSGRPCQFVPFDPAFGCIFETKIRLLEVGGVAVTVTQYQATWTYGGAAPPQVFTSPTLPGNLTTIPANGTTVVEFPAYVRCPTPTCDGSFFAATPGTMSFTVTGTDSTGRSVNFKSQFFRLLPAQ